MCAQIICAHWTPGLDSPQATLEQTPFCKHQKYQRETPEVPKGNTRSTKKGNTRSTKEKHQKYQRETPEVRGKKNTFIWPPPPSPFLNNKQKEVFQKVR